MYEESDVRRKYEYEVLKISYFQIRPLEEIQLTHWRKYLEFEEKLGNPDRIIKLYERCVIPCCLYSEFWIRYTKFLEKHGEDIHISKGESKDTYTPIQAREVFKRVTNIYLKRRPDIHLVFASFEEKSKNYQGARDVYEKLLSIVPQNTETIVRYINFERRINQPQNAIDIFKRSIQNNSKHASNCIFMYIQYARFVGDVCNNREEARQIFNEATKKYPGSKDLWLSFILFERSSKESDMEKYVMDVYEKATKPLPEENNNIMLDGLTDINEQPPVNENLDNPYFALSQDDRESLLISYINFLNEYGTNVKRFRELTLEYHFMKLIPNKKRGREDYDDLNPKKKLKTDSNQDYYQYYYPQYYQYNQGQNW